MPTFNDITSFLSGQLLGQLLVPDIDLSGQTFVVTGANTGLGFECTKHLVRLKASKIILACRNVAKGEDAALRIKQAILTSETELVVWHIDLANYGSVMAFAKRIQSQEIPHIDGFVANAGVEVDDFQLSEGIELTLKVNVVATFMLAMAVLPKLQDTAVKRSIDTRLTIVGSLIHNFGPDAQLKAPGDPQQDIFDALSDADTADMAQRYPLSKLMGHLCSRQLAQHVTSASRANNSVVVNWVNPGWCRTELSRSKSKSIPKIILMPVMGWSAEKGSRSLVHGVTATKETHGHYLSEGHIKEESSYVRSDEGRHAGERIWRDLQKRVRTAMGDNAGGIDVIGLA
ncbi:hypothetical protein LLEC1_06709 [Akanthomyces lecanii]|uniref:Ketoreductase (KR) domain-containing protein n=1 Tax=Cordyceps confragosa TaxID=2714763 RepID=A0A179I8Z5_CORDF|nr:hypothetical protein LLEC1_06709 [Akanthomyces lecanii]